MVHDISSPGTLTLIQP